MRIAKREEEGKTPSISAVSPSRTRGTATPSTSAGRDSLALATSRRYQSLSVSFIRSTLRPGAGVASVWASSSVYLSLYLGDSVDSILTVTDDLSKMVILIPLSSSATATEVTEAY